MLLKTAIRTLIHEKEKYSGAILGVAVGLFLALFQWGLRLGYKHDTTVVLDAFDADVWIIPKNQTSFDGFTSMDDLPYWRAKNAQGVQDVARVVWGYAAWRKPDTGGRDFVQILGIDLDSTVQTRFQYRCPDVGPSLRADGHVLIGTKDRRKLGIAERPDGPFEIMGRHAIVAGWVDEVQLFTTAGFVLTDLENARDFLGLPASRAHYLVCKCLPGADVDDTVRRLRAIIPEHDVLSTEQFRSICWDFWETNSGIGPLLLLSSFLGVLVGFLIIALTFYISTIENIPVYAGMKAIGASLADIAWILSVQVAVVFSLGSIVAGILLVIVRAVLEDMMISLLITPGLVGIALSIMLVCCAMGVFLSIPRLIVLDPGEAFRK